MFNDMFYSAHPNICRFIYVLKNIHLDTNIQLRITHLNIHKTNTIDTEICIRNTVPQLEEHQINKLEFMKNVSAQFFSEPQYATSDIIGKKFKFK